MKYKNTGLFKLLIKSDILLDFSGRNVAYSGVSFLEMNSIIKQYFRILKYFRKTKGNNGVFFLLVDSQYLQQLLSSYFAREGIKNISVLTNFSPEICNSGNILSSFIENDEKKTRLSVKKLFQKEFFISIQNKDFRSGCSNGSYSIHVNFSNLKSLIFFCCILKRELK